MPLKKHFATHGAVHAFWVIAVLLSVIASLIMIVPNGSIIRDYLSFASAVSSIILAVIAIFYSMFSNQSLAEMAGSLKDSVNRTEISSREIGDASQLLASLAERISADISGLTPRFESIESKLERGLSPDKLTASDHQNTVISQTEKKGMTHGLAMALHIITLMNKSGKDAYPREIFDTPVWQHYIAGCLTAIGYYKPYGILIKRKDHGFSLLSLGDYSLENIQHDMLPINLPKKIKSTVDSHFSSNGEQ